MLDGPDPEAEEILRKGAEEDPRIKIVVQDHAGAGAARNKGFDCSAGKYVIFLDADDIYSPKLLKKMVKRAEKYSADVTMCTFTLDNRGTSQLIENYGFDLSQYSDRRVNDPKDIKRYYGTFHNAAWNKLILRSVIEDNGLRFSNTHIMNDVFFVAAVMTCAKRIAVVKEDLLISRRFFNADSITSNRSKHLEDFIKVMNEVAEWLRSKGLWKEYLDSYIILFHDDLQYQSKFGPNQKIIDGVAKTLSLDPPWKDMGNAELKYRLGLNADSAEESRAELKAFDKKTRGIKYRLSMYESLIDNFKSIKAVMRDKYGRDLNKKDGILTALNWSLRNHQNQGKS